MYHGKNAAQWARPSSHEPNRSGKLGWYLRVVNCASEYGLSLEPCGRDWVLVIPRSASRHATGFEVMAAPRSACPVSCPGGIPSRVTVASIRRRATLADSRWASTQPTTYRLKTSSPTYRSYHVHWAAPRHLVISQLHRWLGAVARSSGAA